MIDTNASADGNPSRDARKDPNTEYSVVDSDTHKVRMKKERDWTLYDSPPPYPTVRYTFGEICR